MPGRNQIFLLPKKIIMGSKMKKHDFSHILSPCTILSPNFVNIMKYAAIAMARCFSAR
jgi:hypothetical protein